MTNDTLHAAGDEFDEAARVLDEAAQHLRVAAQHFRHGEVPRGCAHAFAAFGHMRTAESHIEHRATLHAARAVAE